MPDISDGEVIGLVPAAGSATRLGTLPCSKEVFPIGLHRGRGSHGLRPKVVCEYLLERMRLAGIKRAYIIVRQGKWDIAAYFGSGEALDMHLAYLTLQSSPSSAHTLDHAYPFVAGATVALGFPDILFRPSEVFARAVSQQAATNVDIVLGLVPTDRPEKFDMIELNEQGKVLDIIIKASTTAHLHYTWVAAVWTPRFTEYMHAFLRRPDQQTEKDDGCGRELFVADVIRSAIRDGFRVETVCFPDGTCLDIGTPEDLARGVTYASEF